MTVNKLVFRTQDNAVIKVLDKSQLDFIPRAGDIINLPIGTNSVSFRVLQVILSVPYTGYTQITVVNNSIGEIE